MKIWLFDVLACPIDKFFPLKLYIFSFANSQEKFESLIDIYIRRDLDFIKEEKMIETYIEDNEFFLKDNIIIEKTKLKPYIEILKSSLDEFENVYDRTTSLQSKKCINLMNSDVKLRINKFYENPISSKLDNILPEIYFINRIKLDFEIKSGILFCSECQRWYPIIDTIPQMLPDKYRNEKKEIKFLENHKNLLDEKFFNQDLKPFSI
ncbi:MAG: Trm112 family protein [Candidatus Thorarchaeota archaeon]